MSWKSRTPCGRTLSNDELLELPSVGARLVECVEGWQAIILKQHNRHRHGYVCSLRVRKELAQEDIRFFAPGTPIEEVPLVRQRVAAE